MRIHIIAGLDKQVAVEAITPYLTERGHIVSSFVKDEVWRRRAEGYYGKDFVGEAPRLPKDIDDVDAVFCIGPLDAYDRKAFKEVLGRLLIPTYGFWPGFADPPKYAELFRKFSHGQDDMVEIIWELEGKELKKLEPRPPESLNDILRVMSVIPGGEIGTTPDELAESLIPFGIGREQALRIATTLEAMSWVETFRGGADGERGYALTCHAKEFFETYRRTHAKRMGKKEEAPAAG